MPASQLPGFAAVREESMWRCASLVLVALVVSACGVTAVDSTAVDSDETPGDGMLAGVDLKLHKAPD